MSTLQITWKRQRFHLAYTEPTLATTTLAHLKRQCSEITGVPIHAMKLSVTGAVMKDDSATLASYGLRPGSKVTLIGNKSEEALHSSGSNEEGRLISQIQGLLDKTHREITPKLREFEGEVHNYVTNPSNSDLKQRGKLTNLRNYLNEQLMQALFALDGVVCSSEFDRARNTRKAAVKETQMILDRLDAASAKLSDVKEHQ
ncbi:hypothetical protein K493DRAFT_286385 [Basidiobolus meristosporus CBS 931.73]|uniref:BAG domain-containing protein n=1 Tax=Basidiobolus meristosporus CBS 931.73 TaxID=1314790 RepID=A0A1Y1Y1K6_9FUNG|nr:hypothetical protein K493DRAFT_286385 [Basidiobolus meristosporus CBS 931.73]|eukprot:ORX91775.1 hypothetical protein K493DRAFT_286385 [Basidiobolus meristosporus CBS 931.73]